MLDSKIRISTSCADEVRTAISGRVALAGHALYDEGSRVQSRRYSQQSNINLTALSEV